jgi:hypothetical protein
MLRNVLLMLVPLGIFSQDFNHVAVEQIATGVIS